MQVKFELCTEAKTMSDEPWPAAYVVNCRYGNINGGYQKTKEIMNGMPVFHNECAFRCCRRLIGGAAPLPCLGLQGGQEVDVLHWAVLDDRRRQEPEQRDVLQVRRHGESRPRPTRGRQVEWCKLLLSRIAAPPQRCCALAAERACG
jgi:hypothetical protein